MLVTGGSGVLGTRTVEELRKRGWSTRALAHRHAVEGADEAVWGSILDPRAVALAVDGVDAILHLAAVTHTRKPDRYTETNVEGTRSLLGAASRCGIERFVYASTRAINERGGAYSRSKAAAESLVNQSGLDTTIVRLPEVYGSESREGLDRIISLARRGRRIPIVGGGAALVCPIHIDDAAAALVEALRPGVTSGRTYTLAGDCMSLDDFAYACAAAFSSASRPVHVPAPAVGFLAFLSRFVPLPLYPDQLARLRAPKPPLSPEAREDLGFSPKPLHEGLRIHTSTRFDQYETSYRDAVESAISFVGQDLDAFTEAKVDCLLDITRRRLGDPRTVRALDVGCGVGITDSLLTEHLSELHGVDVSEGVIKAARERNPTVSYETYDGDRLPYDDGVFDLAFAICVLHHVPPSRWPAFLTELGRVTKPSGLVVTVEHNPLNPLTRIVVNRCEFDDDAVLLTRRKQLGLFSQVGLTPVESRYILFFPWRSDRLARVERRLRNLPLGAQYMVAGRPSAPNRSG